MEMSINTKEQFDQIKTEVNDIITNIVESSDLNITYNYINNLAIHLTIAIIRIQSNNYIPLSNSQISCYNDDQNYDLAKQICDTITEKYNITFPENEITLATMYLSKSSSLDNEIFSGFDLLEEDVFVILRETMYRIYQKYNVDFRHDDKLYIAIGLHLEPALERLKNNQAVENPLTAQIIERHPTEFSFANELNEIVQQRYQLSFNDDELAFMALHFVVAYNRNK